jgi:hypothetical protein
MVDHHVALGSPRDVVVGVRVERETEGAHPAGREFFDRPLGPVIRFSPTSFPSPISQPPNSRPSTSTSDDLWMWSICASIVRTSRREQMKRRRTGTCTCSSIH